MIRNQVKIFLTALMFYSRIPCPKSINHSPEYLNKASRYFPVIGWIVGAVQFILFFLSSFFFSNEIAILISIIGGVLLTGAFHEDGFADVCDGFGGGWTKDKIISIMKDSRIGAYGTIGIVVLFLLKFFLLKSIISLPSFLVNANITFLLIFVSAHSLSRLAAISIVFTHIYVSDSDNSKSKPIASSYSWKEVAGSFFFGLLPFVFLVIQVPILSLVLLPLLISRFWLASYFKKWIGGYTGDCLGACQQVCELIIYMSIIFLWKFI